MDMIKFPRQSLQWPRGCWPNSEQQLLLKACFLPDDGAALRAWEEWRNRVPLDFVDGSGVRLLLFLHERLRTLPGAVPDMPRLAGFVRHQWVQSQLMRRDTVTALELFGKAGLDTMLLKGAALNATVYPVGLRPMADIDIVVRSTEVEAALELLARHGWRPAFDRKTVAQDTTHACHLRHLRRSDLDLHWDFFHERFLTAEQRDDIWEASVEVDLQGERTRVLCPADQLLFTCEHGMRYDRQPPLRWLADAHRIIETYRDEIDWERCARLAASHGLVLALRQTLRYLAEQLEQDIPAGASTALSRRVVDPRDRVCHALTTRRMPGIHPFWHSLPRQWMAYARMPKTCRRAGFGEFVRAANHLEMPVRKIAKHFARLCVATQRARFKDAVRVANARCFGRKLHVVSMATAMPEKLEGFYSPELYERTVFRWTEPNAAVRIARPVADYQVTMRMLPVRQLGAVQLAMLFNRHRVDIETVESDKIQFIVSRRMFVDYFEQRLVLGCSGWKASNEDPRRLGLPIIRIEFEEIPGSRAPASDDYARAA